MPLRHGGGPAPVRPVFASDRSQAEFFAAYDATLALWPVPVESVDVVSAFGSTHVQVCGPAGGPPLVLLHGGGATSTVWFANVADLAREHRVYAVDQIGDAGRSRHDGRPLRRAADLTEWLETVLDGLGLAAAAVVGHSYGAWLALQLAVQAPRRVSRLVLLDPTGCVGAMRLSYRLHAVPLFARPSTAAMRRFLDWETGGAPLDPTWLHLASLAGGEVRGSPIVLPRQPSREELRACAVPTQILFGERSRQLDVDRAAAFARDVLPDVTTTILPRATHHTLPTLDAARLDDEMLAFLS